MSDTDKLISQLKIDEYCFITVSGAPGNVDVTISDNWDIATLDTLAAELKFDGAADKLRKIADWLDQVHKDHPDKVASSPVTSSQ